ncbi:hypothetical protein DMH88_15380 [Escherichia coli]|nr:hypothetical protein [Escherichia coli]
MVMLFIVTSFNYGDRATLSIAGSEMAKDIGLDPWEWAMCSLPSHGLMLSGRSRWLVAGSFWFKTRLLWSIFIWSMFTLLQGFVDIFSGFGIIVALFTLRFTVGLAEAPSFLATAALLRPGFLRKGNGGVDFNSAQYFATVIFAPIMGWLTHEVGWSRLLLYGRSGHLSSALSG